MKKIISVLALVFSLGFAAFADESFVNTDFVISNYYTSNSTEEVMSSIGASFDIRDMFTNMIGISWGIGIDLPKDNYGNFYNFFFVDSNLGLPVRLSNGDLFSLYLIPQVGLVYTVVTDNYPIEDDYIDFWAGCSIEADLNLSLFYVNGSIGFENNLYRLYFDKDGADLNFYNIKAKLGLGFYLE